MYPFQQHILDKIKERTRGKGEEKEGEGRGSFVYHRKGYNSLSLSLYHYIDKSS